MSWREFFHMGGYALYVWGSYGMVLVVLAAEVSALRRRARTLKQALGLPEEPEQRGHSESKE